MSSPANELQQGARILDAVLRPHGFRFKTTDAGRGSGGMFASGKFVRGEYMLSLSVRHGLGMVEYSLGADRISHENYLRFTGAWSKRNYPGFGGSVQTDFEGLAKDLGSHLLAFVQGNEEAFRSVVAAQRANPNRFKGIAALGRDNAA